MQLMYQRAVPILISSLFILANPVQAATQVFLNGDDSPAFNSADDINTVLKLGPAYYFSSVNQVALSNGVIKHKFTQHYNGVPIWGISLAASQQKSKQFDHLAGSYLTEIDKDLTSITPHVSKSNALKIALTNKKISPKEGSLVTNENVKLYIIQDENKKARLVYLVSFMVEGNIPSRPFFIIDANSKEILSQWEGLTTKNAAGPGGNQKVGRYYYGTNYGYLIVSDTCQMISPNVDTYDMKHLTSGEVIHQFSCVGNPPVNTYKFINGAYSPINDAHYFGNVVFNMYSQWFNKKPLNMKLKMRVHYSINYENAFWDGRQMTFGDGYARFYPLVSLDVVSHEVSHGFTEQNSNLIYANQSGGINESFSDIAGEAAEYFNNPSKPENERNDWLVGASIMKGDAALRYFADPTKDGRSIGHAKDYYDGLDVHYSSGVFNKAFYTLAKKPNWNTEKAFRAFVLANQIYWTQSTDFVDGACGVKRAAQDLTYNTQDVMDAFNVVGVDASCNVPPPPETPELKKDIPINNISGRKGEEKFWYMKVPEGVSILTIKTYNGIGDPDMYVQYGTRPTTTKFICHSYSSNTSEVCQFGIPKAGDYYIMIKGYDNYSGVTLLGYYK